MGTKGGVAARTKAKITTQHWSVEDLNAGSFGYGVLLLVSLSLRMAVTAEFARKNFLVLLASLVSCSLSGLGDLIGLLRLGGQISGVFSFDGQK